MVNDNNISIIHGLIFYGFAQIKGEKALQNTTLHALGLTGKRAIIRYNNFLCNYCTWLILNQKRVFPVTFHLS